MGMLDLERFLVQIADCSGTQPYETYELLLASASTIGHELEAKLPAIVSGAKRPARWIADLSTHGEHAHATPGRVRA